MKVNIVISGDSHFDLKTEGLDRTEDIADARNQIIDYAINLKNEGNRVICLDMGDVFHGTRPRAEVIAKVISIFNRLERNKINTHLIAGNHDVIDQKDKTSALAPLEAINFEHIFIYHDLRLIQLYPGLNLVTIPHISKAWAVKKGFKTAQEYIEYKATEIEEILSEDEINIVIGHMNIAGAKTGTETYMIKGSHEDFPQILKKSKKVSYIFNGHIHKSQIVPNHEGVNIIITGDIQKNDFGERLDTKVFFHLEVEV